MRGNRQPLKVFLTIDTELWPISPDWKTTDLEEEVSFYIYGKTQAGSYGVPYQLDVFGHHRLKAVFFVESLFATVIARDRLQEIVHLVQHFGQEAQLHIHTEWLYLMERARVSCIKDFSELDQVQIIQSAAKMLLDCGSTFRAFRAGNYGANNATLRALQKIGIPFDTSYNPVFLSSQCGIEVESLLCQPVCLNGTWEVPVSSFFDFGKHVRPAQLCACSESEMEHALNSAWHGGWDCFVIVSHGFELLQKANGRKLARPDRLVISRFEKLCAFLDSNRDRFATAGFNDLAMTPLTATNASPLRSHPLRTAARMAEQTIGRLL